MYMYIGDQEIDLDRWLVEWFIQIISEKMLEKRVVYIDHVSLRPHTLEDLTSPATVETGFFPQIETDVLNVQITQQPYVSLVM